MSSFGGVDLFGSGPHEFVQGTQGYLVVSNGTPGSPAPGSTVLGVLELDVIVEGRLVSTSASGLWDLRDAITDMIGPSPAVGTLIGNDGRQWASMSLIRYEELGSIGHGRVCSIAYKATFREFLVTPDSDA